MEAHRYRTDVGPQGLEPMQLLPETTNGNFYNQQHRDTAAYQWIETASHSYTRLGGIHVMKAGIDLLHGSYEGTSDSRSVLIERSDSTLARRLDYDAASAESVHSTDVAVFAQDRFQPASRLSLAFGGRFDLDGITGQGSVTPRIGLALRLNQSGTASLHDGHTLPFAHARQPLEEGREIAGQPVQFGVAQRVAEVVIRRPVGEFGDRLLEHVGQRSETIGIDLGGDAGRIVLEPGSNAHVGFPVVSLCDGFGIRGVPHRMKIRSIRNNTPVHQLDDTIAAIREPRIVRDDEKGGS